MGGVSGVVGRQGVDVRRKGGCGDVRGNGCVVVARGWGLRLVGGGVGGVSGGCVDIWVGAAGSWSRGGAVEDVLDLLGSQVLRPEDLVSVEILTAD